MRAVDDFLIDRVAQPVADRLARYASCYEIAAFLLTGAFLTFLAYQIHRNDWLGYVTIMVGSTWMPRMIIRSHRLASKPPRDAIPAERLELLWLRLPFILLSSVSLLTLLIAVSDRDGWNIIGRVTWVLVLPALYFMACRKRPPARRAAPKAVLNPA